MKNWEINYNGNSIVVENKAFSERLYVNGELQDEQIGFANRVRLWGNLETGEMIKVSIGGVFRMHCRIFVNNKLLLSE
ncbi:hypothetical protein GOQ27_08410 [Clostridium sp. D2Q-11]|uniref:Uncharacterized protein n=1 Tax=Anaeromonas frigoriresistens TaxID=2683708 RepID=A0A942UUY7_9FIRM|nr:hypothetical protein [Anaeromonas frigoriresistens]MBS4538485.1 hypothetical protein [Anaeromonas frigoriresistens]